MGKATRKDAAIQSAEVFALPQRADHAALSVRSLALPLYASSRAADLLTFYLSAYWLKPRADSSCPVGTNSRSRVPPLPLLRRLGSCRSADDVIYASYTT